MAVRQCPANRVLADPGFWRVNQGRSWQNEPDKAWSCYSLSAFGVQQLVPCSYRCVHSYELSRHIFLVPIMSRTVLGLGSKNSRMVQVSMYTDVQV